MMTVFTFLWSLLLIIPGIIKSFSYSQTLYLIKDNPDIGIFEAITESRRVMEGQKWKYFLLNISFMGWLMVPILCFFIPTAQFILGADLDSILGGGILAFSIGALYCLGISLFLAPYINTTLAAFYRQLVNVSHRNVKNQ